MENGQHLYTLNKGLMDTFCISLIKITIKPNRLLKPCFNKSVTQHPFNLTHYDKGKHIVHHLQCNNTPTRNYIHPVVKPYVRYK